MCALPTQLSSIVLEIALVHAIIRSKEDHDDTDWEIIGDESEDPEESTSSSDIEEDDYDDQQEVRHLEQVRRNKTIPTSRVLLPNIQSRPDTVIARTSLANLRSPSAAITPPVFKSQQSTINILLVSDVVCAQVLPLPKAGWDQNVPQPMAGGDHHVPQLQKVTLK
jgi:hypothetical protein